MNSNGTTNIKQRRPRPDKGRRSWSRREEEVLIAALKGIITTGWKSENGFKMGFLNVLEQELVKQLRGTDLRGSGIGCNETTLMIECTDDAWAECLKVDANARLMRHKSWPYYYDWVEIFGKDRATGQHAEDILDAISKVNVWCQDVLQSW